MDTNRESWTVGGCVEAVRRGDPTAHERVLRCAQRLACAKARTKHLTREDADDAAVEVYCAAMAKGCAALLRVKHPAVSLSSWIAGVLDRRLSSVVRQLVRARMGSPDLKAWQAAQRARMAAKRRSRLGPGVLSRLDGLTSRQRHALDLHLEGLSTGVIATRLGIGRDAVRERIWRAYARLQSPIQPLPHADLDRLLGPSGPRMTDVERETIVALAACHQLRLVAASRRESTEAVRSRVKRVRRRALRGG